MKKMFVLIAALLLLLCGCGKKDANSVYKDFSNKVDKSKSYLLEGKMEIINNEETFNYSINVKHLDDLYYKVTMLNETNNHEQIILRDTDGVYVITPALNKSFKFQSEWPFNSSQSYILESLVSDLKNTKELKFENNKEKIIKTEINYPNNEELKYQKLYFNDKNVIEKVEVYDSDDIVKIKVDFSKVKFNAGLKEKDFQIDDLITNECKSDDCNKPKDQETSSILDILYPLYIPNDTYLKTSEKIDTDDGERAILTFAGAKDFILIEEVSKVNNEFEVVPVYGDPLVMADTVAAISANSLRWTSDNKDYYLTSSSLSPEEMSLIASSLGNNVTTMKSK